MLKELAIITICVSNLGPTESAYRDFLDYRVIDRGKISEQLGTQWAAPQMVDHDYILMQPSGDAEVYLRFVQDEPVAGYAPMTTWGWNAVEFLVRNTDAVATHLADSPFAIVGEPQDLWAGENAPRAMQATAPGGEMLYLTSNLQAQQALGAPEQGPLIDRVFIMVVGGPSMDALVEFYGGPLRLGVDEPMAFPITMISKANGLATETTYPLTIARLAPGNMLELDGYPDVTVARPIAPGHIPPGISIVSVTAGEEPADGLDWRARRASLSEFPYNGRTVGVTEGPAGEWLEIIGPSPAED